MLEVSIDTAGLLKMEQALIELAGKGLPYAQSTALTRTATAARKAIMAEMPSVFDRPIPYTVKSVRYTLATKDHLEATVFISDDAPKGISPRKYLHAEFHGGTRNPKRSEKALIARGLMKKDQFIIPARGSELDAYGNVSAGLMTKILSRIGGHREIGYAANATEKVKRRLRKIGLAAKSSGTDYFIARSKLDGDPLGIYQLLGPGKVVPVLYFARRRPQYRLRFPFEEKVHDVAAATFGREWTRAIQAELARKRG